MSFFSLFDQKSEQYVGIISPKSKKCLNQVEIIYDLQTYILIDFKSVNEIKKVLRKEKNLYFSNLYNVTLFQTKEDAESIAFLLKDLDLNLEILEIDNTEETVYVVDVLLESVKETKIWSFLFDNEELTYRFFKNKRAAELNLISSVLERLSPAFFGLFDVEAKFLLTDEEVKLLTGTALENYKKIILKNLNLS